MKITPILRAVALAVSVALVLQTSAPLRAEGPLKVANDQKIAFFGDSTTANGWDYVGGYVKLVVSGLQSVGVKVVPIAAGSADNTSCELLARLDRDVLSKKPDWMILSCGINDVSRNPAGDVLEPYKQSMTAIVDQAAAKGIKVIILTTTVIKENDNPSNQKLAPYNDFLRQLAKDKNLPLVDINAEFWKAIHANPPAPGATLLTIDGIQPGPEGNILMARNILQEFGLTQEQIGKLDVNWHNSGDVAVNVPFHGVACLTMHDFKTVADCAQARKTTPAVVLGELYLNAVRTVLKAHEQEPVFSLSQVQPEVQEAICNQVRTLANAGKSAANAQSQPASLFNSGLIVPVWPADKIPGRGADLPESDNNPRLGTLLAITNVSQPTLAIFKAPNAKGPAPAVIICPGGGYGILAYNTEGTEVANWLNSLGITGIVLKYRVPSNRDGAFQDIQRAIREVRFHAAEWGIQPDKIGVIGFSAGGHLAARASTSFDQAAYPEVDGVDKLSCRPDFGMLIYPAYLDDRGKPASELNINSKIPELLIVHTEDDTYVHNSKVFDAALTEAKIPHEFLLYSTGGHGYGLHSNGTVKVWPDKAAEWLHKVGVLKN